jgi:hypothetical protein
MGCPSMHGVIKSGGPAQLLEDFPLALLIAGIFADVQQEVFLLGDMLPRQDFKTGFPGENAKFWAVALAWISSTTCVSHVLPLLTS